MPALRSNRRRNEPLERPSESFAQNSQDQLTLIANDETNGDGQMASSQNSSIEILSPTKGKKSTMDKHYIQQNLCSHLKGVYFTKDEGSVRLAVQNIVALCLKVCEIYTFCYF